jgi:hypothetical protein
VRYTLLILFSIISFFSQGQSVQQPQTITSNGISKSIKGLPSYARFGIWGLSFYDNALYASTNIGLLKIKSDSIVGLLQWQGKSKGNVVSGPWLDIQNKRLWILNDNAWSLLSFDGNAWKVSKVPEPKRGYTRGDVLNGQRISSTANFSFLEAGGSYWKWNEAKYSWEAQDVPTDLKITVTYTSLKNVTSEIKGTLVRIIPIGNIVGCVMRFELLPFLIKDNNFHSDEVHYFNEKWQQIPNNSGINFLAESVVSVNDDEAFILTQDKRLLRINASEINQVSIIGQCDAIASSSRGKLIASFRNMGIYEFENGWNKKFSAPYPQDNGDYWTYLSENNNRYALTMTPHEKNRKARIWVSSGDRLKEIEIE